MKLLERSFAMNIFFLPRCFLGILGFLWIGLFLSCGGGGSKVSKDSAEYQYAQVKEAVAEVKYEKAISLTSDIQRKFPDTEYGDKARIVRIVLLAGLSEGYQQMAEAYLAGHEKSFQNAGKLRTTAFDYFRKQKSAALGFSEACDYFMKHYSDQKDYVLECEFPTKDVAHNKWLDEVRNGTDIKAEERRIAEESQLREGLIDTLSAFLGSRGDRAKARKLLEGGSKTLDHAEFMVRLGRALLENQKLFGRSALNEVQYYRQFYDKASETSELAQKLLKDKPNKETQEMADALKAELEALEKKGKKT
jgi:hypothetical protein